MGRIPESPEAIHPAWLTQALSERYPGVRVVDVEVAERHEVTNAHARLRVRYDPAAGAPEAMFCKMLPTVEARRRAIALTGMGVREAQFYERLAPHLAIRVPDVYPARCDESDGSFVVLLEDLQRSGCRFSDGTSAACETSVSGATVRSVPSKFMYVRLSALNVLDPTHAVVNFALRRPPTNLYAL